jgi:biotin carboxyl carrier protein
LKYQVDIAGERIELEVERGDGGPSIRIADRSEPFDLVRVGSSPVYSLILGNRSYEISVHRRNGAYEIVLGGETYRATVMNERAVRMAAASSLGGDGKAGELIKAPMPGIVVGISVEAGGVVSPGAGVVTLEAMKMENELKSGAGGVVKEVRVEVGQGVAQGEVLVVIE